MTVVPMTKLLPVMVRVKAGPPAVALFAERMLVVGNGLFIVKVRAGVEVPPPGPGFVTVTAMVPMVNISDAAMAAVTCVPPPLTVPA